MRKGPSVRKGPFLIRTWQFAILFGVLAAAAAFLFAGLPIPCVWDSGSYYQNARFLRTGEYVWEDWYPSFTGPSQFLFPLGGYSLWVYACQGLEDGTGVPWFFWLKWIQFACYLHAGYLVFAIASRLGRPLAGVAGTVLYFAYFQFLNTATLMMSETAGVWLALLVPWLLLKGLQEDRPWIVGLSFLFAGYSMLVRTVLGAMVPAVLLAAVLAKRSRWRWRTWAVLGVLLVACPAAQSLWNRAVFGNYRVRAGSAFNFYSHVIELDQSIPADCPHMEALRHTVYRRGEAKWFNGWWDLAAYLSEQGYSKEKVEEIAADIAWAGFCQNKARYCWSTLTSSCRIAVAHSPLEQVYRDQEQTFAGIRGFGASDRQHAMLSADLMRQEPYYQGNALAAASLEAHRQVADAYDIVFSSLYLQYPIVLGYLVWLAVTIYRVCRPGSQTGAARTGTVPAAVQAGTVTVLGKGDSPRQTAPGTVPFSGPFSGRRQHVPTLVIAVMAILGIVGSCMFEAAGIRYRLTSQPLLLLGFVLGVAELGRAASRRRAGERGAPPGRAG